MPADALPPQYLPVQWDEVENGQQIWYLGANPRPLGPWIVVDSERRIIRPLNGTVQRVLPVEEILVRRKEKLG